MKLKTGYIIGGIALLLFVGYALLSTKSKSQDPNAGSTSLTMNSANSNVQATTTPNRGWMLPGRSTTTITSSSEGFDNVSLNIFVESTSSLPKLGWRYEYSQNNIDWYYEPDPINDLTPTSTLLSTIPLEWNYSPAASTTLGTSLQGQSTSTFFVSAPTQPIVSKYIRAVVYLRPGSGSARVIANMILGGQK